MRHSRRFRFRLCRYLGIPHPDILEQILSEQQIVEWEAYDAIEPIDTNVRLEYMISIAIATMVELLVSTKKGDPPIIPLNFMPDWEKVAKTSVFGKHGSRTKKKKEKEEVANKILQFFTMYGEEEKQNG